MTPLCVEIYVWPICVGWYIYGTSLCGDTYVVHLCDEVHMSNICVWEVLYMVYFACIFCCIMFMYYYNVILRVE